MTNKAVMDLFKSAIDEQQREAGDQPPADGEQEVEQAPETDEPLDVAGSTDDPDQDANPETATDSGPEESEYQDPDSVVALAAAIGRDPSYVYGLKMKLAESGEEVSIGEVKDRLQELSRENRELKAAQTVADDPQQTPPIEQTEHHQLLAGAQQEKLRLQQEWQKVQWDQIERENPVNALLARQKFQEAWAMAEHAERIATQGIEETRQKAIQQISATVPGWGDANTMAVERQQMGQWLQSEYGVPASRSESEMSPGVLRAMKELWDLKRNPAAIHPKPSGNIKPLNPGKPQPPALQSANRMRTLQAQAKRQKGRAQLQTIGEMFKLKLEQQRKRYISWPGLWAI